MIFGVLVNNGREKKKKKKKKKKGLAALSILKKGTGGTLSTNLGDTMRVLDARKERKRER